MVLHQSLYITQKTQQVSEDTPMKSLEEQLAEMLEVGSKIRSQEKKLNRKRNGNPSKKAVVTQDENGKIVSELVDIRLASPHWKEVSRVITVRRVHCRGCNTTQEAPNELLFIRKTHAVHGILEEAIGIHAPKYSHLPIEVEYVTAEIHICQHCCSAQATRTIVDSICDDPLEKLLTEEIDSEFDIEENLNALIDF
jgi:hypothetical protein